MSRNTAAKLTHIVSWILIIYSLVWATAAYGLIDAPARLLLDTLAWPVGDGRPVWDQQLMWLSSIGAGLVMALGVFFHGIVTPALREGDWRVIKVTIAGIVAWYVIDSAGSIAAGFFANAVINTLMLVPLLAPLVLVDFDKA